MGHSHGADLVGLEPARSMAALMAAAPRLGAAISLRLPPKVPIVVRAGFATERGGVVLRSPFAENAERGGGVLRSRPSGGR
jgi:hypothetical protein